MPDELHEVVLCRMNEIGDEGKHKLLITMKGLKVREPFVQAMLQIGAEHKRGSPPLARGRELSLWAEALSRMIEA